MQHIMSLGTFKRTFFYAAPSDPLMLQWADVLENAKNSKDGELELMFPLDHAKGHSIVFMHYSTVLFQMIYVATKVGITILMCPLLREIVLVD